jgi:hypothetical protein
MKRKHLLQNVITALFLLAMTSAMAFAQQKTQDARQAEDGECKAANAASKNVGTRVFVGESKKLGNGFVRSWMKLDEACKPAAIGLTFSEEALTGLPMELPEGEHGVEYSLALPEQAALTPFKHIGLNWNPKGHEPEHIYTVGHFDFHFYQISEKERAAISAEGEGLKKCQKQPAAEFVPEDYMYAPGSEFPRMGSHWVDKMAHELHGHPFTATYIYGSYDGQFIFQEPMITKAFLESKPNLSVPIKQATKVEKPGYYPTSYSVKYDPQTREYSVALEGLVMR